MEAEDVSEMRAISMIKGNIQAFGNTVWLLPSILLHPTPKSRSNRVMFLDEVVKTVTENTETFNSCFSSVFAMKTEVLFIPPDVDRKFYLSNRIGGETISAVCNHFQISHLSCTFYQLMSWFKTEMELAGIKLHDLQTGIMV